MSRVWRHGFRSSRCRYTQSSAHIQTWPHFPVFFFFLFFKVWISTSTVLLGQQKQRFFFWTVSAKGPLIQTSMRHPPTLPQDLMAQIWSNSDKIADYLWKPSYGPLPLLGLSYPLHHISKACLNLQEFRGLQTVKQKEYLDKVVFGSRASSRAIGGGASCSGFHHPVTATSTCTSLFLLLTSPCWRCHFLLLLPNPLLLLLLLYINQKQLASLPVCLSALTPEVMKSS